jgi:hypothetical protein
MLRKPLKLKKHYQKEIKSLSKAVNKRKKNRLRIWQNNVFITFYFHFDNGRTQVLIMKARNMMMHTISIFTNENTILIWMMKNSNLITTSRPNADGDAVWVALELGPGATGVTV